MHERREHMCAQLYSRVDQYLTMSLLYPYHVAFTRSFHLLFHVNCFDNFVGISARPGTRTGPAMT